MKKVLLSMGLLGLFSSVASGDIAVFAYTVSGEYVGEYVLYSANAKHGIEGNLCSGETTNIEDLKPEMCTQPLAEISTTTFKDQLFFSLAKDSYLVRDSKFLVGDTMAAVQQHCNDQLPEYSPAAAQMLSENKDLAEIFSIIRKVNLTIKAMEAPFILNFISRNPFVNISGDLAPINAKHIVDASISKK